MKRNPYKKTINKFFNRQIEIRHISDHLNKILLESIEQYKSKELRYKSYSALVISDWSGPSDNGWEINQHTGAKIISLNYEDEVHKMISTECCFSFVQSFEVLETLMKDAVLIKAERSYDFKLLLKKKIKNNITRNNLYGGDTLFKWVKKAGEQYFISFSKSNNKNFQFKVLWTVLSKVRHAIVHSSSQLKRTTFQGMDYHMSILQYLFTVRKPEGDLIKIDLNYEQLKKLNKLISGFGFQVFKSISLADDFNWENFKN